MIEHGFNILKRNFNQKNISSNCIPLFIFHKPAKWPQIQHQWQASAVSCPLMQIAVPFDLCCNEWKHNFVKKVIKL